MLSRQQSTVPVEPSTAMLTHRLKGTTDVSASNRDEHRPFSPRWSTPDQSRHPTGADSKSSRTTVRFRPKAQDC